MKKEDEDPWERYKRVMDDWPFGIMDEILDEIVGGLGNMVGLLRKPSITIGVIIGIVLGIWLW